MTDKNLGHATAYGYAKSKGYTGTEEEFAELMASYAEVAESAKGYAEQAEASATNAETSETNARTSAQTASAKASEASASASNAQTSASNAQASATIAGTSASSASASAQTASTKASEASDSATSASESASTAVSAKDDAVTAKEEAETAKADAETAAEEAQESAQTVANKADKDGTYPDMTVGGVMSSDGSTDSTPYLYRVSGGGVEVGTVEEDSIVGGTVAWNQMINFENLFSNRSTSGITYTKGESGDISASGTAIEDASAFLTPNGYNQSIYPVIASHVYALMACPSGGSTTSYFASWSLAGNDIGNGVIAKATETKSIYLYVRVRSGQTVSNLVFKPRMFDLTQMFGSAVADMIYNMETANTGSGVAFFRSLFPNDYYEYNAGELKSVEGLSAHIMRDADDNIIGNYPLDSSLTLRGIPKVADGKMYYDGDVYSADGTVTRKYGIVDMGTLKWNKNTDTAWFSSDVTDFAFVKTVGAVQYGNAITSKYIPTEITSATNGNFALYFNTSYSGYRLFVYDDFTGKNAAEVKAMLSGVLLVYELKEPTEETAEPYTEYQKVSKYGTEEYVSTSIVPVGHVTKYLTDIVSKVDGLPSDFSTLIAPTETGFKATRAYSVNQFIIVNNQLYRVTSAIASGATITVGTNVVVTTVADILTSLLNA